MTRVGIRELKDNLSRYVRKVEAGARVAVTANGRVVAELGPPSSEVGGLRGSRLEALIGAGDVTPATGPGESADRWPTFRLPKGTVASLIDADRGER